MSESIIPPADLDHEDSLQAYADFVQIVRRLRRDCPWDREQTHRSVRHLLIEEAYEAVHAIDNEEYQELKKELGDLFLHVVFHSVIAEESSRFDLKDLLVSVSEKLIRRHPHVYGATVVEDVDDVLKNWEQIKQKEGGRESVLQGVPHSLPALLQAHRVQEKAAGVGFDFPDAHQAWDKVKEEIAEFEILCSNDSPAIEKEKEFGDLLFSLVNFARFHDIVPEDALRNTNQKFRRRFNYVESALKEAEIDIHEAPLDVMDKYWDQAKKQEIDSTK